MKLPVPYLIPMYSNLMLVTGLIPEAMMTISLRMIMMRQSAVVIFALLLPIFQTRRRRYQALLEK
jgi:hypothetical protein